MKFLSLSLPKQYRVIHLARVVKALWIVSTLIGRITILIAETAYLRHSVLYCVNSILKVTASSYLLVFYMIK